MTDDDKKRIEEARKHECGCELASTCPCCYLIFVLAKLDEAHAALREFADISLDFVPKGEPFRDYIIRARKALGELE